MMVPLAFFGAILALLLLSYGAVSPSLTAYVLVGSSCLLTVIVLAQVSLLAGLGVVALAGVAQSATAIWFPVPITLYLDDLPLLLTVIYTVIIAFKRRLVPELRVLGLVLLLVGIAVVRAGITSGAIYQARQVLDPFLIAFAAFVAVKLPARNTQYKPRLDILIKFAIGLAALTCVYMLAEFVGAHH